MPVDLLRPAEAGADRPGHHDPEGIARDLFEVTNRSADKLAAARQARVEAALAGELPSGMRLRRPWARPALRRAEPVPEG